MKQTGMFLISVWLIVQSLIRLTSLHIPYQNILLASIALMAGVVLLLHVLNTKISHIGMLLLSIWLILRSSIFLFGFSFPYSGMALDILGLVAGVFLLIKK